MTSNIGASYLNELPDEADTIPPATRELVHSALRTALPIEFVNRVDSIILYERLSRKNVRNIVDIRIGEVQQRLRKNGRDIKLDPTPAALDFLASVGYHPLFGARPLNRSIQTELLNPLSRFILDESIRDGETARIDFDAKANRLVVVPNHEPSVPMDEDNGGDTDDDMKDDDLEVEELD